MDNQKNTRKRKSVFKSPLLYLAIVALLLLVAVVTIAFSRGGILIHDSGDETLSLPSETITTTELTTETTTEETTTEPPTEPPSETTVSVIDGSTITIVKINPDKWYLTLVNRYYSLPTDYVCETADLKGGRSMDARAAVWFDQMYDAALADGITISINSGYRSIDLQQQLYDQEIAMWEGWGYDHATSVENASQAVLPPGTSEHNLGLALDIGYISESFENSSVFDWLTENAANYGFVLRYPADKVDITKIEYEPWHWRYIGVEDALNMKALGITTLEEYLGILPPQ